MAGKYRWIPILLAFVTLLSCSKKNPVESDNTPQPDYYPISSGSWWKYSSYWDYTDSIGETDTLSNGSTVFALYTNILGTIYKTYVQKTNNEIRKYYFLNDTSFYFVILKSPLYVGLKWEVYDYNDTTFAAYDSMFVTASGTVTVAAGTFTGCYQLLRKRDDQREGPGSTISWYAPNVGFIFSLGDSTELVSYSIK